MIDIRGLVGLRPAPADVACVSCPPYDVIKPGSTLEATLEENADSVFHVTLGAEPQVALTRLRAEGLLVDDDTPALYVYEQTGDFGTRTGVFVAAEVSAYAEGKIIRHEKTFDAKVQGRLALRRATAHSFGPVFLLTRAKLGPLLEQAKRGEALYDFHSDFGGESDLHGLRSRVFRVPEASDLGQRLRATLGAHPLYIADGHHRYHTSLVGGQTHALAYVTGDAEILAYDRVVTGTRPIVDALSELELEPLSEFATPPKHAFALYTTQGSYLLRAERVPDDVVGRLDCAILERELYPKLGLEHDMITDPAHFDYFPESALDEMRAAVDSGAHDLAIALHPVSIDELVAVADAGLGDANVVMPEKSTFFSPKVLTGLFIYRHTLR
ncbi:MAG: DUF1015 domain-containing protein [Deltaproteobacteria bacterium]|nr:DUF1015 domain-containing protein [Deltaproteobacteria bacterium]